VGFDTDPDRSLALSLEGAHTARRIVHAGGSAAGKALTDRLIELVEASPAIGVRERTSVVALWNDRGRCAAVMTDSRAALDRQESRGAPERTDFSHRDPALDRVHLVIDGERRVRREQWT
jgi:aspartate oxidase